MRDGPREDGDVSFLVRKHVLPVPQDSARIRCSRTTAFPSSAHTTPKPSFISQKT